MTKEENVTLDQKYCLTVTEAAKYFGIGEKKLRAIISNNLNADYLLCNGKKYLIKRKLFEQYIDGACTL